MRGLAPDRRQNGIGCPHPDTFAPSRVRFALLTPYTGVTFCTAHSSCGPTEYCFDDVGPDYCRSCASPGYPCTETTALGGTCDDSGCPSLPAMVSSPVYQGQLGCGGDVTGTTTDSISVVGNIAPDHSYSFYAPHAGVYVFDSCASTFDTWLMIYRRSNLGGAPAYSCDDCGECSNFLPGSGGLSLQTVANVSLMPGDYVLVVEGTGAEQGSYGVSVSGPGCLPPPTGSPVTSGPTQSPATRSPVTSEPTRSPATSEPSRSPATSEPSRSPPTSEPTRTPPPPLCSVPDAPYCCGFDIDVDCQAGGVIETCPQMCNQCPGKDPLAVCQAPTQPPSEAPSASTTAATTTYTGTTLSPSQAVCASAIDIENSPLYVAVDPNGDGFWVTHSGGVVRKYAPDGTRVWASSADAGTPLVGPTGIATNPTSGAVYVADQGTHKIVMIDPETLSITTVAGRSIGDSDGDAITARFSNPSGVSVGNDGTVYVADLGNHKIRTIVSNADGSVTVTTLVAGLNYPSTLAIQPATAGLYIARSFARSVLFRPANGRIIPIIGEGTGLSSDGLPLAGLAVNPTGTLYVADNAGSAILEVAFRNGQLSTLNVMESRPDEMPLQQPMGLAIDAAGTLHIVDRGVNKLWSVNPQCLEIDPPSTTAPPTPEPSANPTPAPTDRPRSDATCEDLQACGDGRWSASAGGTCIETRVKANGTAGVCDKVCQDQPTIWYRAYTACFNVGARLCSQDELDSTAAQEAGCGGNTANAEVWSAEQCPIEGSSLGGLTAVRLGGPVLRSRCAGVNEALQVRCCADAAPTMSPTSAPTRSPTPPTSGTPSTQPTRSPTSAPSCPDNTEQSFFNGIDLCSGPRDEAACCAGGPYSQICANKCCGTYCGPTVAPSPSPSPGPTPLPSGAPTSSPTECAQTSEPYCFLPQLDLPKDCCGSSVLISSCEGCCGHECGDSHSYMPTGSPSAAPSPGPTTSPTPFPSSGPSSMPTSNEPTGVPSGMPSSVPTGHPTPVPTGAPTTPAPTQLPTSYPTNAPTMTCEGLVDTTDCSNVGYLSCLDSSGLANSCADTCCRYDLENPVITDVKVLDSNGHYLAAAGVVPKGAFKHGYVPISIGYKADIDGLVDLLPIVRSVATGISRGVLDGARTTEENAAAIIGVPATGIANMSLRLLSVVDNGDYSVQMIVLPTGTRYPDRLRSDSYAVTEFTVRNEFVRFVGDTADHVVWAPELGQPIPPLNIELEYWTTTDVKFAVQIRCFVPATDRVGDLEKCDNRPRFINNGRTRGEFVSANNIQGSEAPTRHQISATVYPVIPRGLEYRLQIAMGRFDDANGRWLETRDRTDLKSLAINAQTTTMSPTLTPTAPTAAPTRTPTAVPSTPAPTATPTLRPTTAVPTTAVPSSSPTVGYLPLVGNDGSGVTRRITCGRSVHGSTVDKVNVGGNPSNDVFYEFIVPETVMTVMFDACASDFDTQLRILRVNETGVVEVAACDDCGDCGARSALGMRFDSSDPLRLPSGQYVLQLEGGGTVASNEGAYWVSMICDGQVQTPPTTAPPTLAPSANPTPAPSDVPCINNMLITTSSCAVHSDCNSTNMEYCAAVVEGVGGTCQYCWECAALNDSVTGSCPVCQGRSCFPDPGAATGDFANDASNSIVGGKGAAGAANGAGNMTGLIVGLAACLVLLTGVVVAARSKAQRLAASLVSGELPVAGHNDPPTAIAPVFVHFDAWTK